MDQTKQTSIRFSKDTLDIIDTWTRKALDLLPPGSQPTDINGCLKLINPSPTDEEIDTVHRLNK